MGKKKKRKKGHDHHAEHHQQIHEYIMNEIESADRPPEAHIVPLAQDWHVPATSCWCRPKMKQENPLTGATMWVHSNLIH